MSDAEERYIFAHSFMTWFWPNLTILYSFLSLPFKNSFWTNFLTGIWPSYDRFLTVFNHFSKSFLLVIWPICPSFDRFWTAFDKSCIIFTVHILSEHIYGFTEAKAKSYCFGTLHRQSCGRSVTDRANAHRGKTLHAQWLHRDCHCIFFGYTR